jgi:hypothetical protein
MTVRLVYGYAQGSKTILAAFLGRDVNRSAGLSPLAVTVVTMGIGSVLLLAAGIACRTCPE